MQVEDVTGVRLARGRPAQQERELAVGVGVLAEVVVDDERVPALLHEPLAHGAPRVGSDVLEGGGVGRGGGDDGRVLHGAELLEGRGDLGDGGGALADGDVDAGDVAALLIDDGVEGDRGLAGLAVADDQLALPPADREHGVDRLDAGLQGGRDGLTEEHPGGDPLQRHGVSRLDGAPAVDRLPQGVEDAPDHRLPRRHLGDPPRGADGVPLLEVVGRAQDDRADAVLAEVQGQPQHRALAVGAGEGEELAGHRPLQAIDPGDAVADRRDHALARLHHCSVEARDASLQDVADLVASYCHRSVCP